MTLQEINQLRIGDMLIYSHGIPEILYSNGTVGIWLGFRQKSKRNTSMENWLV